MDKIPGTELCIEIIRKYYAPDSEIYNLLVQHSLKVAEKALEIAGRVAQLKPDLPFIFEASMLHDIGIFLTWAPELGCRGKHDYVYHGYLGRKILESEGMNRHALVCERHVGVGLTREDIRKQKLALPDRDMVPVTLEEKIICFADKFYSKSKDILLVEQPAERIIKQLAKFGTEKVEIFRQWLNFFGFR